MRITGKVEVNMRTRELRALGEEFAWRFVDQLGALTVQEARANVTPGHGPGPHPHRPPPFPEHVDTGELAKSIQSERKAQGFLKTVHVFSELDYGSYLELGWVSEAGNFWRYPWLEPAAKLALQHMADVARSTARAVYDSGLPGRRRMTLGMPSFATWQPGVPDLGGA